MKMKQGQFHILLFLMLLAARLSAQPVSSSEELAVPSIRPAIGGFADLNLNMAHANFSQLPGIPDCNALYQSGTGIGPAFGIFYEMPLQHNFSLLLRGGFDLYGEKLTSDEQAPIAIGGVETPGIIEHSITATLGMIGLQPLVNYHITTAFAVHLGAEIGFVIQSSFSQIETLTQPTSSGVFENGLRTRNAQSGNIPNVNPIVASLVGGVSYQLPLNKSNTLQAVPELSYAVGLTPVVKSISWSVNALRGGVAIRFEIPEKPVEIPKPIDTVPPPPPPPPMPIASITAYGIDDAGMEGPAATLKVEEVYSATMTPLVPYIFFDEHEQLLPARYNSLSNSAALGFDEIQLKHSDAMSINHQTLNVVGKRLSDDPAATVQLAGITFGKSNSPVDRKLALARAETIGHYLRTTWNLPSNRIRITSRPLTEETIAALDSDGISEANRVEIISNSFDILKPVMGNDTIKNVTPPVVRFHPSVSSGEKIASWRIVVSEDGQILKTFNGSSPLPVSLDWILADDPKSIPKFPGKVDYNFTAIGPHDEHFAASGSLPVEQVSLRKKKVQRIADREIEKFNLLLFDLQSSELNETNKQIIDLIQKHLKDVSTVTIVGHTDRTGDAEINRKLSLERARNTAKALGVTKADIRGIGSETILYDNSLPEGRCLSRTVDIIVETPTDTQ
jgi:outer membrane protein OmpA-like peptidoglycan-associated protein